MKKFLMASAATAVLSLGLAAPAVAACTDEIAALKSQAYTGSVNAAGSAGETGSAMPAAGAGAAETAGAAATNVDQTAAVGTNPNQTTGDIPPVKPDQMASAGSATGDQSSGAPGMGTDQVAAENSAAPAQGGTGELGGTPPAGTLPGTEATAAMNAATEGIATSPAEVGGQQTAQPAETAPSADQLAAADQPLAPTAPPTSGGEPVDLRAAMLARAEAYEKLGNEAACMNVVDQAKAS